MKLSFRHIIVLVLLAILVSCSQNKKTDWRVTFDRSSKQPYGCYLAYHLLEEYFYSEKIEAGTNLFKEIDNSFSSTNSFDKSGRLSIVVCRNFQTDSLELDKIIRYIKQGNAICILAENFSEPMFNYFHLQYDSVYSLSNTLYRMDEDTINNQKTTILFNQKEHQFLFNGLSIEHSFTIDSNYQDTYLYGGYSQDIGKPNMMFGREGTGTLMICRNPITMTNHFLLQNNNREYLNYFYSNFSSYPNSLTWYSFYQRKVHDNTDFNLSWLLKFPPLFYAFLLLASLLLLYTLFESKRRQRTIPILTGNNNSSLEFTETVGMLYYNKKDNKNLSDKMILHYLENLRSKYNLKTNEFNGEFISLLSQKINQTYSDTKSFVAYITYIRDCDKIHDIDIKHLYHQLQKFN